MKHAIFFATALIVSLLSKGMAWAESRSIDNLQTKYSSRYFEEVDLPSGRTHFQASGDGPTVILVHGVSGPLAVWDRNIDLLVGAGYKVVRYDLFGRGFSQRLTNTDYSLDLYQRQLEELISALNLGPHVRLVGSSFGAVVATEYALRHPDRVEGLVLIGPAGFPISVPWTARLKEIPVLGGIFSYFLAHRTILKQNDHYFVSGKMPPELRPFVAAQLSVHGTSQAILSTMDHSPVQSYVESYQKLGKTGIPIGVVWGRQDVTFPYENSNVLLRAAPQSKLITVENSGHLPQYERPNSVNPAIIEFLKGFDHRNISR